MSRTKRNIKHAGYFRKPKGKPKWLRAQASVALDAQEAADVEEPIVLGRAPSWPAPQAAPNSVKRLRTKSCPPDPWDDKSVAALLELTREQLNRLFNPNG